VKTIQIEDVHYRKVSAFVDLSVKQRRLYAELKDLRKRGEPYSAKENKNMLRIVLDMEMCEAKFSEIFSHGDIFKGHRLAQLRLLKLLDKRESKSKKPAKKKK
jgi:hypothetical protein